MITALSPVRLLLILTEFPPSFGGMQAHAVHLARHLHDAGHELCVVTYRGAKQDVEMPQFPFVVHRILSRISYEANLDQLCALAKEWNANVIYSSTVYYGQLAERTGLPVFCRSAGNDVMRPWIAWPFRLLRDALDQPLFERHFYARLRTWAWPERMENFLLASRERKMLESLGGMSRVFANSEFTRRLLLGAGAKAGVVELLCGGVDARHFVPGDAAERMSARERYAVPEGAWVLLTACRIVPKKGIDLLLGAMPRLVKKIPQVHLLIAGTGPGEVRLRTRVSELGMEQRVTWLGRVEHEQMPGCYAAADAFVLASQESVHPATGQRDVETMGRVLCEANACGVPVVAAASGGIPSVITDGSNGLLFREGDADELVAAVVRLHRKPKLQLRMVRAGLERARSEFDWPHVFAAHDVALATLRTASRLETRSPQREILPQRVPASPGRDPASAHPAPRR